MKITPIFSSIPFKSNIQDDENVLAFDDEISRQRRQYIREHYTAYTMPFQSIYENEPRKTEYQMQALLKPLLNKPPKVDGESIMGLPVANISQIGENSYRGATLVDHPEYLQTLKDAGIKRVIDLCGYTSYENDVKQTGLDYFSFNMKGCSDFRGFWYNDAFKNKDEYLRQVTMYLPPSKIEDNKAFIERQINIFENICRPFIEKFVKFIQNMQKDYCYIGCEFGTYDTSDALLLDDVFNPKSQPKIKRKRKIKNVIPYFDKEYKIHCVRNLYAKLTDKDKKLMGWTEEFEKNFLPKLKTAEKRFMECRW